MTCPAVGQVKKQLTEADYKLWSTLEIKQLSERGNWVSFSSSYENGKDTLFVKNTTSLKTYTFAGSSGGKFASDNFFLVWTSNGELILTELNSGTERRFPDITNYSIALGGELLIMLKSNGSISGDLLVVGKHGTELLKLPNVSLYSLNPHNTKLVCDSGKKLHLIDLKKIQSTKQIDSIERHYTRFAWQKNGLSFAWCSNDYTIAVGQYRLAENKHFIFEPGVYENFPITAKIANPDDLELSISDDAHRVFFNVIESKPATHPSGIQIWNTADKVLYASRAAFQNYTDVAKLAVWFPDEQLFRMVTSDQYPRLIAIAGQQHALVYNPLEKEPQFDSDAPINYYLQNITTGHKELFLSKHSADGQKLVISNKGKYIAYFKDNHWWIYDVLTGKHRNLTAPTKSRFIQEDYDRSGEEKVSGIAGWTENDSEVLIYDNYDLWLLKSDGSKFERLTDGREHGIVYRIVSKSPYGATGSLANGILNLSDGILLQAVSDRKSGCFIYSSKRGMQQLVYEGNRIGSIKRSENGAYCYIRENYHLSAQLVFQFKNSKPKVIYESNSQQKNYAWGFSRLISYENSKGQQLNGALFYPANYDADTNYPMIVHIYERQSDLFNQYVNPTLYNTDGFNITNYTTQGYFVLLPDIAYEEGKTGNSAVDCVVSAVNEVLAHESLDPKRLGIFGHSFGGYETNFIITQTNKFAAAISGAGIADIVSSYFTVGRSNKKWDGWRYEFNQFRIGSSLFDNYERYIQNSPIIFANQIITPLLLWCGEGDNAINYSQSLEMHLALRRLQKPNIFLMYEQGGHALMRKEDQVDLTHRMLEWFDYYLKEGKRPEWFEPDKL